MPDKVLNNPYGRNRGFQIKRYDETILYGRVLCVCVLWAYVILLQYRRLNA